MKNKKTHASYMLRRNLALWKADETIEETIEFCIKTGIGEIIWKIDAEEFNHGFTPHELIREYLPFLEKAKKLQEKAGIVFSINPWVALNHDGRARYLDGPPADFHWRVYPDGQEVSELACPLSRGWRKWFLEAYRLYASLKPDKLWIEDEFKTFGHCAWIIGCYCDDHIQAFSEKTGEIFSREELVKRITASSTPDPIREQWFDFQGETMVNVCRELESIVHNTSATTRLGLMCSYSPDGRWWNDGIKALAGPLKALSRTSLAAYNESRPIDFLPDQFDILKEMTCLPEGTENCPELENYKYTPFSKSTNITRLQILLAQVLGNRSITMNLFDMLGSPLKESQRLGKMLKKLKPVFDGIASLINPEGIKRGVNVPYCKKYANDIQLPSGSGFEAFKFDGEGWMMPLQGSGIPVSMNNGSPVTAITGQILRSISEDEIKKLLSKGLLLDGSATHVMQELGFGEYIGAKVSEKIEMSNILISAERDDSVEGNSDGYPVYMSMQCISSIGRGGIYQLEPLPGAETCSVLVDNNHEVIMPGMLRFENKLGGRVVIFTGDISPGIAVGFMNWQRRRQLQRAVKWLYKDKIDLFVDGGAWMMPMRMDYPDYTLIAVLNFETDHWDNVELTFDYNSAEEDITFEILDKNGMLREIIPETINRDGKRVYVSFAKRVEALDHIIVRVSKQLTK